MFVLISCFSSLLTTSYSFAFSHQFWTHHASSQQEFHAIHHPLFLAILLQPHAHQRKHRANHDQKYVSR